MRNRAATGSVVSSCPHGEGGDAPSVSHVTSCVRGGISVYDAREILRGGPISGLSEDVARSLATVTEWLDGFVNRPHAELGRSGEVCPWTRRTLELGRLVLVPIASDDAAEVDAIILSLLERFWSMEPTRGADAGFRSIIAVFHRLDPEKAAEFVVAAHTRLKPTFLDRGLMLGEFYRACEKPGLRNPHFRPLRSPIPLLVIRQMVEPDIEFLLDRNEFVDAYLRTHGGRGAERLLRVLGERPAGVSPERMPGLLRLAEDYREAPRSERSSPRPLHSA